VENMADTNAKASSWLDSTAGIKAHDERSGAGKFNDGFMGQGVDDDKPTAKTVQPAGVFPIAGGSETPYAKPVHAPDTLIPTETVKGYK
jgi:hypothetical protein